MSGRSIAMWSGPRNISTAMMRAWGNRSDTVVIDEPFYAHFLHHTGLDHPMRDEVIAQGTTDWRLIVEALATKPASGIVYQKHICSHWLDHYSTQWLDELDHVFLIRDPAPVVSSYSIKRDGLTSTDLGYTQQATLFDLISTRRAQQPLVIDSKRFLSEPAAQLEQVCSHLNIDYQSAMLSWPSGPRETDGVWGQHWYDSVNQSTRFAPARTTIPRLDVNQQRIVDTCQPYYEALAKFAL